MTKQTIIPYLTALLVAVGASTMAMAPVLAQTASEATAGTAAGDTKETEKASSSRAAKFKNVAP
jgi:hypothetical protein